MKKIYTKKNILTALFSLFIIAGFGVQSAFAGVYYANINYIVGSTPPPPPSLTVTLLASPNTMTLPSNQTTLTWSFPAGTPTSCNATSSPSTAWNGTSPSTSGGSQPVTGLTAGSYIFSISCTDGTNTANDSALVVVNSSGPDLTAGPIGPTVATLNASTAYSGTITNQGNANASSVFPFIFQTATSQLGANAADVPPSGTIPSLNSGASVNVSSPGITFSTTGFHWVRVCADMNSISGGGGTITESNEGNNCGAWTRVMVSSQPPSNSATVTLYANGIQGGISIFSGDSADLTWTSQYVSSCTASATPASVTWVGSRPVQSTPPPESTGPLSTTTGFTISCTPTAGGQPVTSSVKVNVSTKTSGLNVTLTALPDKISPGQSSVLSWNSTSSAGPTTCEDVNFPTGGAGAGTLSVSPTVTTTYKVKCTDGVEEKIAQAIVTLKRRFLFIEY